MKREIELENLEMEQGAQNILTIILPEVKL